MKTDDQSDIRAAFRRRRRALGMTQAMMAEKLGISRMIYSRIEGPSQPRMLSPEIRTQIDKVLTELEAEMKRQSR